MSNSTIVCDQCGKRFSANPQQIAALCPHCGKKQPVPGSRLCRELATSGDQAPARARGIVEATEEDLAIINASAPQPLTADQVYVFEASVSTNALDSYFTRMAESSLANYVEDGNAANPLMTGHDYRRLPIGRSCSAKRETIDGLDCVIVRDYMLKGHNIEGNNTDDIARGIQGGTLTDLSITFGGPDYWYRCSVCNRDLWDPECPHVPGLTYGDMQAFAWVEDARMIEHSIVYKHATPGSVMRKAREAAEAGQLTNEQIGLLEESYRCRLLSPGSRKTPNPDKREERQPTMKAREFLARLAARLRGLLTDDMARLIGLKLDDMRSSMSEDATVEDSLEQIASMCRSVAEESGGLALAPYRALGINSIDDVKALQERAKLGDQYRTDLIADALAAGVRYRGADFNKERQESILGKLDIEEIRMVRDEWEAAAKARFGEPGRQTSGADPNKPNGDIARSFDKMSDAEIAEAARKARASAGLPVNAAS